MKDACKGSFGGLEGLVGGTVKSSFRVPVTVTFKS